MITVEPTFADFEQARLDFVRNVSKFAETTDCIEIFQAGQTVTLLKPLITDPVSDIRTQASRTLLRLIDLSEDIANEVVDIGMIPSVVQRLTEGDV